MTTAPLLTSATLIPSGNARFGVSFVNCDPMQDELPAERHFDVIVLCEVLERLAIPSRIVLAQIHKWICPAGYVFLTIPNLYRLNLYRSRKVAMFRSVLKSGHVAGASPSGAHPASASFACDRLAAPDAAHPDFPWAAQRDAIGFHHRG